MLWLLWSAFKCLGVAALLLFAYLFYLHVKKIQRLKNYGKQGAFLLPGYDSFPLGNIKSINSWVALSEAASSDPKSEAVPQLMIWSLD